MHACINAYVDVTIFTKLYSVNMTIFSKRYRQIYVHQGRIEPPQCVIYSPHALALGNKNKMGESLEDFDQRLDMVLKYLVHTNEHLVIFVHPEVEELASIVNTL